MSIYGDQLKNRISQDRKYRKKNERILGNSVHCNNREYSDALSSDSDAIREILRIADYLDAKCEEINTVLKIKKEQVAKLEEYKKSLIYEYVTGKKEVPDGSF